MTYQGAQSYMPTQTVDEVAEYTDMMGSSSFENQKGQKPSWRNDATKSLIFLWVVVVVLYFILGFFFRRYSM